MLKRERNEIFSKVIRDNYKRCDYLLLDCDNLNGAKNCYFKHQISRIYRTLFLGIIKLNISKDSSFIIWQNFQTVLHVPVKLLHICTRNRI